MRTLLSAIISSSTLIGMGIAACGGKDLDVGVGTPRALVTCEQGVTSPADGSCHASCCAPRSGTESNLTSPQQALAAIAGQWQLCSSFPGVPDDVIGIQFDPPYDWDSGAGDAAGYTEVDGTVEFLVQGASGPVPGQGFAYESSWGLFGQGNSYLLVLAGEGTSFLYSPCPTQLELQVYYDAGGSVGGQNADTLLVPF